MQIYKIPTRQYEMYKCRMIYTDIKIYYTYLIEGRVITRSSLSNKNILREQRDNYLTRRILLIHVLYK